MKLSDDQKKLLKGGAIYAVGYIITFCAIHLIKGDLNWSDVLKAAGLMALTAILVTGLIAIGSHTPKH